MTTDQAEAWPQPREGVTGRKRSEKLLSLDAGDIPVRLAMLELVHCLWDALLVGDPAPRVHRMWERVRQPQPGDLVAERFMSGRRSAEDTRVTSFGILLEHRREWWQTDEEWAAEMAGEPEDLRGNDNRCTDHAWYIQYGQNPDDICRWVNCEFWLVPTDAEFYLLPFGKPTPTGGVAFERPDVVAALADSGLRAHVAWLIVDHRRYWRNR